MGDGAVTLLSDATTRGLWLRVLTLLSLRQKLWQRLHVTEKERSLICITRSNWKVGAALFGQIRHETPMDTARLADAIAEGVRCCQHCSVERRAKICWLLRDIASTEALRRLFKDCGLALHWSRALAIASQFQPLSKAEVELVAAVVKRKWWLTAGNSSFTWRPKWGRSLAIASSGIASSTLRPQGRSTEAEMVPRFQPSSVATCQKNYSPTKQTLRACKMSPLWREALTALTESQRREIPSAFCELVAVRCPQFWARAVTLLSPFDPLSASVMCCWDWRAAVALRSKSVCSVLLSGAPRKVRLRQVRGLHNQCSSLVLENSQRELWILALWSMARHASSELFFAEVTIRPLVQLMLRQRQWLLGLKAYTAVPGLHSFQMKTIAYLIRATGQWTTAVQLLNEGMCYARRDECTLLGLVGRRCSWKVAIAAVAHDLHPSHIHPLRHSGMPWGIALALFSHPGAQLKFRSTDLRILTKD